MSLELKITLDIYLYFIFKDKKTKQSGVNKKNFNINSKIETIEVWESIGLYIFLIGFYFDLIYRYLIPNWKKSVNIQINSICWTHFHYRKGKISL